MEVLTGECCSKLGCLGNYKIFLIKIFYPIASWKIKENSELGSACRPVISRKVMSIAEEKIVKRICLFGGN